MNSLSQVIYKETDQQFLLTRLYRSIKTNKKEHGIEKTSLAIIAGLGATVYTGICSYFLLEGCVRSYIDVHDRNNSLVGIRPLGDAGGWMFLSILSIVTLTTCFFRGIREGEYKKLDSICNKWIVNNQNMITNNQKLHENLYPKLNLALNAFNSSCLFNKSLLSMRLKALNIYQNSGLAISGQELTVDKQIEPILGTIHKKIGEKTSWMRILNRWHAGRTEIRQESYLKQLGSLIMGVVLPIFCLTSIFLSFIGEVGLGYEIYHTRESLTDTGHLGEWPLNAVEALTLLVFAHEWSVISKGDLSIVRNIYSKSLQTLQDNPLQYNRMVDLANEDLYERAKNCQYVILPYDYQFEKI